MPNHIAPAKINLMLHVTNKQASGYHTLQSLFTFVPSIHDRLDISKNKSSTRTVSLEITGPFSLDLPSPECSELHASNSIIKAATWLQNIVNCSKGVIIHLTKNLPIASGIGGGSSDAAAAIAGLLHLWDISLTTEEKWNLVMASGELGADVPACLAYQFGFGTSFWIEGSGKETLPIPVKDTNPFFYVLVNPTCAVPTADVFRHLTPPYSTPILPPSQVTFDFVAGYRNDLTTPASQVCPTINLVLAALRSTPGCILTRLSGSGATCFGLLKTQESAEQVASHLRQKYPSWWVKCSEE